MNGTQRCSHSFGQYTKWWTLLYFLLMLHCFWCHRYFVCHRVPLDDHRLTNWKPPPQDHKLGKPIIATSWTAWVTHVDAIEGLIFLISLTEIKPQFKSPHSRFSSLPPKSIIGPDIATHPTSQTAYRKQCFWCHCMPDMWLLSEMNSFVSL